MKAAHMEKQSIPKTIPLLIMKEKELYVAFSPALELSTCGKTVQEARQNFTEALGLFFEECLRMRTLDQVLESCGWVKDRDKGWVPPTFIGEENITLPVSI